VPADPDWGSTAEKQLRHACAELDDQLRAGKGVRAEMFFAAHPLLASHPDYAVELIYAEFAAREELGGRPTVEEYYFRFPHWTEHLKRQFSVHEWLRHNLNDEDLPGNALEVAKVPTETDPGGAHRWLGQYELLEEIASGGCGRVYKAWQHGLDRVVAVKILLPAYSSSLGARERFCREAKLMASLPHPNIMPVHDIGESRGILYFSMDFMPGGSLAGRLTPLHQPFDPDSDSPSLGVLTQSSGIEPRTAVGWLEVAARAVHYAHEHKVIHRDLKPSNILLDDSGRLVISDFGLAKLPSTANDPGAPEQIVGSPAYMAPEQLGGDSEAVTAATDIWALGVILYELLTGQRPFAAVTLPLLQRLICLHEPTPLRSVCGEIDERLENICRTCLAKSPAARYRSALELAEETKRYLAE
jgi:serine/threonine-protein kinase